ncbi:MAG: hypothetical protein CME62_15380 [Halobacteriovoraceae bacterium]|nr:hypothetical protein [Halobacteriovoraceae bacterium]|tara:strand:- start:23263 stop:23526 length:264 start_codon:yes stop_codon:yes gene_type:complete
MKKYLLVIICMGVVFSTVLVAKDVDLSTFNKHMATHMDEVIEHNPEMYDTQNIGRKPASVMQEPAPVEETTDKLDKFERQANGPKNW